MSQIPIPNNENTRMDPNYRYQRNQLQASKTKQFYVIENLDLVCSQLKVDKSEVIAHIPKYLKQGTKMFGDKIGVKTTIRRCFRRNDRILYYQACYLS